MRNAGKMDDLIYSLEQRSPVEGLRQIRMLHHFDASREGRLRRPPHGRAEREPALRKSRYHGTADEARCAGYQHARHNLSRSCTTPWNKDGAILPDVPSAIMRGA
jgi:hypothetical protein